MVDVTVVVPFWDLEAAILHQCLDSINAQGSGCQVLIIDNASTIPVPRIAGTRIVRLEERVSVGMARNRALQYVRTPYLMFMDADDVLVPGAIPRLLGMMRANPLASMAAGGIDDWICETNFTQPKDWPGSLAYRLNRFPRLFRLANVVRNMTPVTGCAVLNTDMVKTSPGFPDSTAEDWTFGVHMTLRGPVLLTREKAKLYRWRAEGLSKKAVWDLRALWHARCVTRQALTADKSAPQWMRSCAPLLVILHAIEMPFHIRRERRFSDLRRISTRGVVQRSNTPSSLPAPAAPTNIDSSEGLVDLVRDPRR